ncbi:MAG: hypothetical protein AAFN78_17795 [Pseudomonadota bacterium]
MRYTTILLRALAGSCLLVALSAIAACSPSELAPFTSDGCSLFPDSSVMSEQDWCLCCFEHDVAYWRGGTKQEREHADALLRQCILDTTGSEALATVMHEGVRAGGSPYFYNWYRWGYGWGYERKYQALTADEVRQADQLEAHYRQAAQDKACGAQVSTEDSP